MTSTYTGDKTPIDPAEQPMFAAPLYPRRKPKADRAKPWIYGGMGALSLAVLAGALLASRDTDREVAAVETTAPLAVPALPAVAAIPLAPPAAILEPQPAAVTPTPRSPPDRVARAAPRRTAPAEDIVAPSAETATADVSATAPDVATPPAELPVLPPITAPASQPPV